MNFLRFPGVAGSNISTPDVNLLDSDSAHLHQSFGQWVNNVNSVVSLSSDAQIFGSYSLKVKRGGAASNAQAHTGSGSAAVSPSTTYAASFAAVEGTAGKYAQTRLFWFDSGGAYLSASGWSPAVLLTASEQTVSISAISDASAASASVAVLLTGDGIGSDPGVDAFMYLGKAIIAEGSDPTFVPSLRIVGGSSVVVDPTDMQWSYTVGDELQIGDEWAGDGISLVSRDGPGGPIVAEFQVPDIGDVGAVPPGTQWQDITGRTWTSSGSLEILDWLYGYPVEDLAAYLDAELPDGVQVYSHAADIGKLPAVVLVPGNPAIALTTMAGAEMTLAWGIEATLVVNRSQPLYGTRLLVDLWRQIATACIAYSETVQVLTLEEIGTVEWSGGEAMAGTMPLILTQAYGLPSPL